MAESSARTLVTSILFLDIIGYSKKSVSEQIGVKKSFNDSVANALKPIPPGDRVILDTGDGAAITFLGNPEDALFSGLILQHTTDLEMRMGINLGPVRIVKDLNDQVNILGDGINVGQRVMSFADTGQLLVSQSFYELMSRLSDEYHDLFTHLGERKDKHVRAHEVYSVNLPADALPEFVESTWGEHYAAAVGLQTKADKEAEAASFDQPARVFNAGAHYIVSGPSQLSVLSALEELKSHETTSDEYAVVVDRMSKLHKLKVEERPKPISRDTAVVVAANIFGILWLTRYERENVISTKALGFILKPR